MFLPEKQHGSLRDQAWSSQSCAPKHWAGALTDLYVKHFFSPFPLSSSSSSPPRFAEWICPKSRWCETNQAQFQFRAQRRTPDPWSPSSNSKPAGDLHLMHFNWSTKSSRAVCVLGCEMHLCPSALPLCSAWLWGKQEPSDVALGLEMPGWSWRLLRSMVWGGELTPSAAAANGFTTNPAENMSSWGLWWQRPRRMKEGPHSCAHAYQQTTVRVMYEGCRIKSEGCTELLLTSGMEILVQSIPSE